MDVEGRESRREAEQRTYFVIHAGIIRAVGDVETFRGQLQIHPLAEFVLPGQARVEVNIVGTEAGVARGTDGPLVRRVVVPVDLATGEQVEG